MVFLIGVAPEAMIPLHGYAGVGLVTTPTVAMVGQGMGPELGDVPMARGARWRLETVGRVTVGAALVRRAAALGAGRLRRVARFAVRPVPSRVRWRCLVGRVAVGAAMPVLARGGSLGLVAAGTARARVDVVSRVTGLTARLVGRASRPRLSGLLLRGVAGSALARSRRGRCVSLVAGAAVAVLGAPARDALDLAVTPYAGRRGNGRSTVGRVAALTIAPVSSP